ncbi:MAG: type IV pilus assembly protein PilM [Actinomycetota bacterium]|nr:type IV pilus assembly protein PilM [Actinomycetota bacterium]MDP9486263.1 type IV pilus assembly protein PilM [Actinomycetota bacterium]
MERFKSLGGLRGGSRTIGMDIDRGALKAVQVSGGGGGYVLQHVGYHRLPPGAVVDGEVGDHDLLAAEIREFWDSHSFGGRSVVIGVSNQQVVVRLLEFPRMEPEDLKGAIGFEAQDHIPMPLSEAVLDYVVLGPPEEGSGLDRVLVVAAQREMVDRYVSALRTGGLRPVGVDVKALSLTRSILPDPFFAEEGAVVLLDVGSEITNLVIADGGKPVLTRFIPGGLDDFVASVADAADLPADEAEKQTLSPRVGLGFDHQGEGSEGTPEGGGDDFDPALVFDVRRGLEAAAQALADDVQRSLEHHHSQAATRDVSRVLVSGEGALIAGLDGYLGELLGVATGRGEPVAKLSANRSNVSDEQLRAMEPVLAVALGLALEDE